MSEEEVIDVKGALHASLERSNKEIRQERGDAIAEDLQIIYKRNVEDIEMAITRATRDQANAFDFSPTNSQSLVMAKEIQSVEILDRDMGTSLAIRELEIKYEIAKKRYNHLFGKTYDI